jgi:hypothetical protein
MQFLLLHVYILQDKFANQIISRISLNELNKFNFDFWKNQRYYSVLCH